jgi:hypothetical protein
VTSPPPVVVSAGAAGAAIGALPPHVAGRWPLDALASAPHAGPRRALAGGAAPAGPTRPARARAPAAAGLVPDARGAAGRRLLGRGWPAGLALHLSGAAGWVLAPLPARGLAWAAAIHCGLRGPGATPPASRHVAAVEGDAPA